MNWVAWTGILILGVLTIYPLVNAATTATTLFTFNVPTSKAVSITYQSPCTTSAFFFNEADANFDPDTDGNAARVKPRGQRNLGVYSVVDYNTAGITSPNAGNGTYFTYSVNLISSPTGDSELTEVDTNTYTVVLNDDSDVNVLKTTSVAKSSRMYGRFRLRSSVERYRDLNISFIGEGVKGTSCEQGTGTKSNLTMAVYNTTTDSFDTLTSLTGSGASITNEIDAQYMEYDLNGNFSSYVDNSQMIRVKITGPTASSGNPGCLLTDRLKIVANELPVSTDFCQSGSTAPMLIANVGNTTTNFDANFASAFSGVDSNLVLKMWQADASIFCGTNGLGGWEEPCGITDTTADLNLTSCKKFDNSNANVATRLGSNLAVNGRLRVCYSGDFNAFVEAGDHNQSFQITGDYS